MISIGLPAVKPQYLEESIRSLLAQEFRDFELIAYNDRADPAIRAIVSSFDDPRIRYFEGEGPVEVVKNWNRVLSLALGEYFILCSDDDRCEPGFLAEMIRLAENHPNCRIFHCRVTKIGHDGVPFDQTAICPPFETGFAFIFHRMIGEREQFAPEFMVKTQALREIGGFVPLPLAWGSDDMTWFRLALNSGIAYTPQPLVGWRRSPGQISEAGDPALRLEAVERYIHLLGALLDSVHPSNPQEAALAEKSASMLSRYEARQKAHLLAVSARHTSAVKHISFFLANRGRYGLKVSWLLYSLYAKYLLPR